MPSAVASAAPQPAGTAEVPAPHPSESAVHHHDIDLSRLPEDVRKVLAEFDTDGSGTIGTEELAMAGKMYKDSLQTAKRTRIAMAVASVVFTIVLILQFGVMFAAIQLAKDSVVGSNSIMTTKSGSTVQLQSSDFAVAADGSMTLRTPAAAKVVAAGAAPTPVAAPARRSLASALGSGGFHHRWLAMAANESAGAYELPPAPQALTTAEAVLWAPLSSDLSVDSLQGLKWINIQSPTGALLFLQVQGLVIMPAAASGRNGPATFITNFGHVTLIGPDIYYNDDGQVPIFASTGFVANRSAAAGLDLVGRIKAGGAAASYSATASATPSATPYPDFGMGAFNDSAPRALQGGGSGGGSGAMPQPSHPWRPAQWRGSLPLGAHARRRLEVMSMVGTFSATAAQALQEDIASVQVASFFPAAEPTPTPEPAPALPPAPAPLYVPATTKPSLLPLSATGDADAYWGALFAAQCPPNATFLTPAPPPQLTPLYLLAPGLGANASLGSALVALDCYTLGLSVTGFATQAGLVAGGVNMTGGGVLSARAARFYLGEPRPENVTAAPPATWLWQGTLATGAAALGGVLGNATVALQDVGEAPAPLPAGAVGSSAAAGAPPANATAPLTAAAGAGASVTFAFAEPPTPTSPIGVRGSVTSAPALDAAPGCVSASGAVNATAVFGSHVHAGSGRAVYTNCQGNASWSLEGLLGGFTAGAFGPLAFATPHFSLAARRQAQGNWTGAASGVAALGETVNLGITINIIGQSAWEVRAQLPAAAPGEQQAAPPLLAVASQSLYYTYSSAACGSLRGAAEGAVALGGAAVQGHGTLTASTCAASAGATWAVSLSLGSFSLLGQRVLSAQLNATRPDSATAPWGGLALAASAVLGGLPAALTGVATAAGAWALNASLATPPAQPGASLVAFAASGPLALDDPPGSGCVTLAAAVRGGFAVTLGAATVSTAPGVLTFNSCTGAFSASVNTSTPLALGPATLPPRSTLGLQLSGARTVCAAAPAASAASGTSGAPAPPVCAAGAGAGAAALPPAWSVTLAGSGSAGPTIALVNFWGTAQGTPASFSGAGQLVLAVAQGGATTAPGAAVHAFNLSGTGTLAYSAALPGCGVRVTGAPTLAVATYLTDREGPLTFTGKHRAAGGALSSALTYACPDAGGLGGGWAVAFSTPLSTPARAYNATTTLPSFGAHGASVALLSRTSTLYSPPRQDAAWGPLALRTLSVTLAAREQAPGASDWGATLLATGAFTADGELAVVAAFTLATRAQPYGVALNVTLDGSGGRLPFAIAGVLPLAPTSTAASACFAGAAALNVTALLPLYGAGVLHGPGARVSYSSCALRPWAITSAMVSQTALLNGGASLSPAGFAFSGGSGNWSGSSSGVVGLGGAAACNATLNLTATDLSLRCARGSAPTFFANRSASASSAGLTFFFPSSSAAASPIAVSPLGCVQASVEVPLLGVVLAGGSLNTTLANVNMSYFSSACAVAAASTGSSPTASPSSISSSGTFSSSSVQQQQWRPTGGAQAPVAAPLTALPAGSSYWVSSRVSAPPLSVGGLALRNPTVQLTGAPVSDATLGSALAATAWAVTGSATAFLGVAGATPAAAAFGSSPAGSLATTVTASIATPAFTLSVTLTSSAPQTSGPCGSAPPWQGTASGSLLLASPPLPLADLRVTFNPCTGAMQVGGDLLALQSTPASIGGAALSAQTIALSGTSGAWAGTLGVTDGDVPKSIAFTGASTASAPGTITAQSMAVALPGYGFATAPLPSLFCSTPTQGAAATLSALTNLPPGLPAATSGAATLTADCDGSGAWKLVAPLADFAYPMGKDVRLINASSLVIERTRTPADGSAPAYTYTFSGQSIGLRLTLALAGGAAAPRLTSVPSSRRALAAGSASGNITSFAPSCSFPSLSDPSSGVGTLRGDVLDALFAADVSGMAMGTTSDALAEALGCLDYTGALAGATGVWGLSAASASLPVTVRVCPADSGLEACSVGVALGGSLPSLSLPPVLTDLASSLTDPVIAVTSAGVSLKAASATLKGLELTDVGLSLSSRGGANSYTVSGAASATLYGAALKASFTASGASPTVYAIKACMDTTGTGLPFELVGCTSYVPGVAAGPAPPALPSGAGSITSLTVNLGGRVLRMLSAGTITLAAGVLTLTAPLPGASFGGLAAGDLTFSAATHPAAGFTITVSGAVPLPGLGDAVLSVALSPVSKAYTIGVTAALSTPVVSATVDVQLQGDSATCAVFSGTVRDIALSLGSDSLFLSDGMGASFSTCDSSINMTLPAAVPKSFSLGGQPVLLTELRLARAPGVNGAVGPWLGSLAAAASVLPFPDSWDATQSLALTFTGTTASGITVTFAAAQGEQVSLAGSLAFTPPSACAVGGLRLSGSAAMTASIPMPDGSTLPFAGTATVTVPCAGGGVTATLSLPQPHTVDLGVATVVLSDVTVSYASGGAAAPGTTLTLSGVVDSAVTVSATLDTAGAGRTAVLSASTSLHGSVSLGTALDAIGGSGLAGSVPGLREILSPVLSASVAELVVSVAITTSPPSRCLYLRAIVERFFGAPTGVAGQLCSFTAGGVFGSLALALDPGSMSLPGAIEGILGLLDPPSLTLGLGAPPPGALGKVAFPSAMPSLSAARASLPMPALLAGVRGVTLTGSLPAAGNIVADFISLLGGMPDSAALTASISAAMSASMVSVTFESTSQMTASLSLGSGASMSLGGGATLSSLALVARLTPTSVGAGLSAVITSEVKSGKTSQLLTSAAFILASVQGPAVSLALTAGFALSGGSGNWERAFGLPGVTVLMPLIGSISFNLLPAPPFLAPTKIAYAGGVKAGGESLAVAFSVNIADPSQNVFSFTASNIRPVGVLTALIPISPNPLAPAAPLLGQILPPVGLFAMTYNPLPAPVVIGEAPVTVSIPPGVNVLIENTKILAGLVTIRKAYLRVDATSLAMGAAVPPVDLFGLLTLDCGDAPCGSVGPTFSLDISPSSHEVCLRGGGTFLPPVEHTTPEVTGACRKVETGRTKVACKQQCARLACSCVPQPDAIAYATVCEPNVPPQHESRNNVVAKFFSALIPGFSATGVQLPSIRACVGADLRVDLTVATPASIKQYATISLDMSGKISNPKTISLDFGLKLSGAIFNADAIGGAARRVKEQMCSFVNTLKKVANSVKDEMEEVVDKAKSFFKSLPRPRRALQLSEEEVQLLREYAHVADLGALQAASQAQLAAAQAAVAAARAATAAAAAAAASPTLLQGAYAAARRLGCRGGAFWPKCDDPCWKCLEREAERIAEEAAEKVKRAAAAAYAKASAKILEAFNKAQDAFNDARDKLKEVQKLADAAVSLAKRIDVSKPFALQSVSLSVALGGSSYSLASDVDASILGSNVHWDFAISLGAQGRRLAGASDIGKAIGGKVKAHFYKIFEQTKVSTQGATQPYFALHLAPPTPPTHTTHRLTPLFFCARFLQSPEPWILTCRETHRWWRLSL